MINRYSNRKMLILHKVILGLWLSDIRGCKGSTHTFTIRKKLGNCKLVTFFEPIIELRLQDNQLTLNL